MCVILVNVLCKPITGYNGEKRGRKTNKKNEKRKIEGRGAEVGRKRRRKGGRGGNKKE